MQWTLLLSLLYLGTRPTTAQFVFFGNQFGAPQSRPQPPPQPAPQAPPQRFGVSRPAPAPVRLPVQPAAPALTAERFSETFFRPTKKLINPKKDASPEEKHGHDELVQILTERPLTVESPRSSGESRTNSVVLPAKTVTATTSRPTTARPTTAKPTTARPTTARTTTAGTTTAGTTTARPTTAKPSTARPTTAKPTTARPTAARVTPLQIKSFVVDQFGRAVSSPLRTTPAPAPTTTQAPRPVSESRRPKAVSVSPAKGNYQYEGKSYLLTWREHRNNFDWRGGVQYCRSQGMKLISMDSKEKSEHFLRLVATDRAPYFWAGGQISRDSRTLTWQNGKTEVISRGQHPWSFTGRTGPQPDGGEVCLAVLNSVYRDGVKYHDVACHHRKPVVCEE